MQSPVIRIVRHTGNDMDGLLVQVDIAPPSLALGQGAYESGYGISQTHQSPLS